MTASMPANIQTSSSTEVSEISRRLTAVVLSKSNMMGMSNGIDNIDINVLFDCSELAISEMNVRMIAIPSKPKAEEPTNKTGSFTG